MQLRLPLFKEFLTLINSCLGYEKREGWVYYFHSGMPIYSHSENNIKSFRYITSNFVLQGLCTRREIADAFNVSYQSVKEHVKKLKELGEEGFFKDGRQGHAQKLHGKVLEEVQALLDKGATPNSISKRYYFTEGAIRYAIKQGKLKKNKS